jgi:methionyl-tRNA formyltransferase
MGTPDFAAIILRSLIRSGHEVAAAFTRPDKPKNRGKKILFSPVKELAVERGIPVFQPPSLKNGDAYETLKNIDADCIAVAAYGLMLPEEVLALPKYGCINVHASLLPEYRGAAPINRCVMDGAKESGVTVMRMDAGLDTGDMLLREKTVVTDTMTAGELRDILAEMGARLLPEALGRLENGGLPAVKQDGSLSSYAAMISKSDRKIDFSKSAREVYNHIRGLADYPCAYTFAGDKRLKVYRAVVGETAGGFCVTCGDGEKISLTEIQAEGGRRMRTEEFLKGRGLENIKTES